VNPSHAGMNPIIPEYSGAVHLRKKVHPSAPGFTKADPSPPKYTKFHQSTINPFGCKVYKITSRWKSGYLILGNLDPVEFAQDNLLPEHVAAVIHLKRDLRQQMLI
jgi:hypothetical protein